MIRKLILAGAAATLALTPILAEAAPAHRAPAAVDARNEHLVGLVWQYLLLPIILGAVIALVAGGHNKPVSP